MSSVRNRRQVQSERNRVEVGEVFPGSVFAKVLPGTDLDVLPVYCE